MRAGRGVPAGAACRYRLGCAVAAAIVLLLAFVAYLSFPAHDEYARLAMCSSNLKCLATAIREYASDHQGRFPPGLGALFPKYLDNPLYFFCPSNRDWAAVRAFAETGRLDPHTASYIYVSGLDGTDDTRCVLLFDRPGNHGKLGVQVMLLGGDECRGNVAGLEAMLTETRRHAIENGHKIRLIGWEPDE